MPQSALRGQEVENIKQIGFTSEDKKEIRFFINESQFAFISIDEAIDIIDELKGAIKKAANI